MIFFSFLISSLFYLTVWTPYRRYAMYCRERDFHEKVKAFKLIAVRRYYKSLKKYSFEEIEEKYNVDYIYDMIGRV